MKGKTFLMNDKTTLPRLRKGIYLLLSKRHVSVQDFRIQKVCKLCGMPRSTFYRIYGNIHEVILGLIMLDLQENFDLQKYGIEESIYNLVMFIETHKNYFRNSCELLMYQEEKNFESEPLSYRRIKDYMFNEFLQYTDGDYELSEFLSGIICSIIYDWGVAHKYEYTCSNIIEKCCKVIEQSGINLVSNVN